MTWTKMKCPECGKQRTMLPEWEACGICRDEGEDLSPEWFARHRPKNPGGFRKLTCRQIENIRKSAKTTGELARQYGVHRTTIWRIKQGYRRVA